MAPFFSFLALFLLALSATVFASPHIPRHHAHRAPADAPLRRSLNARSCIPQPSNTTSAYPTSSSSPVPINVAPSPSVVSPSSTPSQTPTPTPTPTPTSTPMPTPTPAPTSTPTTTSATASYAAPVTMPSSASDSSGVSSYFAGEQHGFGTWFQDGLGACGYTSTTDQYIVAVAENLFDNYPAYNGVNPNTNPVCGRKISLTYGQKTILVEVVDRCVGCKTSNSLDLSRGAFSALADIGAGVIDITWVWA